MPAENILEVHHLKKSVGQGEHQLSILTGVELVVKPRQTIALIGESGSGKSALLAILAGLDDGSSGEVSMLGKPLHRMNEEARAALRAQHVGFVFQSFMLIPTLNALENVELPALLRGASDSQSRGDARALLEQLGLGKRLHHLPAQLSGGEQQRVALARAIVRKPKAFLMDEPLSNLDAKLRNSTRIEIVRLQQRLGVTTIYVTHDQTEAMTMADRIVVMKEGVIQQVGTPQEIYAAPVNLFVASFIGTPQMNFIPGKLSETGFENESFRLSLPDALKAKLRSSIGKEVILGLRPEALAVSEGIQENTIPVRLEEVEYMGRYQIVHAMVGGSSLVLSVPSDVKINPEFYVSLSMDKAHFFDGETTRSLLCREVEENHA